VSVDFNEYKTPSRIGELHRPVAPPSALLRQHVQEFSTDAWTLCHFRDLIRWTSLLRLQIRIPNIPSFTEEGIRSGMFLPATLIDISIYGSSQAAKPLVQAMIDQLRTCMFLQSATIQCIYPSLPDLSSLLSSKDTLRELKLLSTVPKELFRLRNDSMVVPAINREVLPQLSLTTLSQLPWMSEPWMSETHKVLTWEHPHHITQHELTTLFEELQSSCIAYQ